MSVKFTMLAIGQKDHDACKVDQKSGCNGSALLLLEMTFGDESSAKEVAMVVVE